MNFLGGRNADSGGIDDCGDSAPIGLDNFLRHCGGYVAIGQAEDNDLRCRGHSADRRPNFSVFRRPFLSPRYIVANQLKTGLGYIFSHAAAHGA